LVRNGLARIYGKKITPPGLSNLQPERQKLQQFEDEAKQEKIGGWGINTGRLNVRAEKTNRFTVFTPQKKSAAGSTISPNVRASIVPFLTATPTARITTNTSDETKSQPLGDKVALGKIDINTATEKELRTVPGIGAITAARIIAARPFESADDLRKVNGIGDKRYAQLRPYFR
jgi:DNA uptake protein ComE-like DNA-binding protein